MSLQIWLPLINNMNNQGLAGDTIVTSNAPPTSNISGKLGKCYSFNGNNSYISIDGNFRNIFKGLNNPFSIAFWVYHNDEVRGTIFGDYNLSNSSPYFNLELKADHSIRFYWYQSSTPEQGARTDTNFTNSSVGLQTWTHVVVTYSGTEIKWYINGSDNNGSNSKTFSNGLCSKVKQNGFYIGRDSRTGETAFNGKLNDFRIYDHCLSAAEVTEIAKGLVLHYKLNYMNLINKNTLTTNSYVNTNGTLNNTSGWYATDYIPVQAGKTYQTIGLSTGGSGTYIGIYNNSKVKTRTILMTANQNNNFIIQDNEKYVRLSIRNLNNELKNALFYEVENNIYDCSGYQNNGTIISELSAAADSPKYETSTQFSGSQLIEANSLPAETSTLSAWINFNTIPTSNYTIPLHDKVSGLAIGIVSGNRLISYVGSSAGGTGSCVNVSLSTNIWYHIVIIKTGSTTRKVYINGEEITSIAGNNWWGGDLDKFNIGGRHINGSYSSYFNGKISDIRAYATTLSAAAIKELYDTSASIDASGNVYARELKEV